MALIASWVRIDGEHPGRDLSDACERLHSAGPEVVLDMSEVRRVDPTAIVALERLAARGNEKAVKVTLRGVNVEVYKVLKLMKLSPRFDFVS